MPEVVNLVNKLAQRLVMLAKSLSEREQLELTAVITQLFTDIESGHSCSKLNELAKLCSISPDELHQLLLKSGLTADYVGLPRQLTPLPLSIVAMATVVANNDNDHLIYISKYLAYELSIVRRINELVVPEGLPHGAASSELSKPSLEALNSLSIRDKLPNSEQLAAIRKCSGQKFSIITGGPGTGKTTAVTLLLWLFYQMYGSELTVKVCAPTGKAALRVYESIKNNIKKLSSTPAGIIDTECLNAFLADSSNFSTLHKLLGFRANSIYFKHGPTNLLDVDIIIVDESSMIGLPLFSKLLEALDYSRLRHIIFLGDPNQLSSVEEGYVFASMVGLNKVNREVDSYDLFTTTSTPTVSKLVISNRNQGEIGKLAELVLRADVHGCLNLLQTGAQVRLLPPNYSTIIERLLGTKDSGFLGYFECIKALNIFSDEPNEIPNTDYDLTRLFAAFTRQSVLCLTNTGRLGTIYLNQELERQIKIHYRVSDEWYSGRPIIIMQNDYSLELFNGDIGICRILAGHATILFENGRSFIPEVLPEYQLAYAITIHKSQGSEYQEISIVFGPDNQLGEAERLLSRELLYTAITRAKTNVSIFADAITLERAITKPTIRHTGLTRFLG